VRYRIVFGLGMPKTIERPVGVSLSRFLANPLIGWQGRTHVNTEIGRIADLDDRINQPAPTHGKRASTPRTTLLIPV